MGLTKLTVFALVSSVLAQADDNYNLFARQVTSYSPAQTTACLSLASTCFPTVASCTPAFCSACASLGGPDFVSCCNGPTAAGCIASLLPAAGTQTNSATITTGPSRTTAAGGAIDTNSASCQSAFDLVTSCAVETQGFTTLYDTEQASCLCYTASGSSTVYAPKHFDALQSACVDWASTSYMDAYSVFSSAAGLCTSFGDVRASTAASSSTETDTGALTTRTQSATTRSSSASRSTAVVASSSAAAAGVTHGEGRQFSLGWLVLGFGWLL